MLGARISERYERKRRTNIAARNVGEWVEENEKGNEEQLNRDSGRHAKLQRLRGSSL
jgi:hypothetical protein